jgi:hypothetical protein
MIICDHQSVAGFFGTKVSKILITRVLRYTHSSMKFRMCCVTQVLDATFDDLEPLALPRMPGFMSGTAGCAEQRRQRFNSVADPGYLSRILIFTHPKSRISDPGSKNNNKREG